MPVLVGKLRRGIGPYIPVAWFEQGGSIEHMGIDVDAVGSRNVAHGQYLKAFAALVE